jgi:hypothetical protein
MIDTTLLVALGGGAGVAQEGSPTLIETPAPTNKTACLCCSAFAFDSSMCPMLPPRNHLTPRAMMRFPYGSGLMAFRRELD